jgi:hypothetical protein
MTLGRRIDTPVTCEQNRIGIAARGVVNRGNNERHCVAHGALGGCDVIADRFQDQGRLAKIMD